MLELENQTKGMHGNYSIIGKISAEKYPLIMNKEKFLTGKENKPKKFFYEEENEKITFRSKDELDPFTLPPNFEHDKYKKLVYNQRRELCDPNYSNPNNKYEKWKYHQIHHKIDSEKEPLVKYGPNCTKYTPKYDNIFPRSISGPKWEDDRIKKTIRRKKKNKNDINKNNNNNKVSEDEEEDEYDDEGNFYTKHGDLEPENTFIILKKQTMRPPNSTDHDTRIRRDKAFITESDLNDKINIFDNELTTTGNTSSVSYAAPKKTSTKKSNLISKKNSNLKKIPTFNKKNSISNNTSTNIINIKDIKGPDFNNYISRATLDFISRDKEPVRPFFVPDYSYTIPRLINAVNYSQSLKKTIVQSRMKGLNENPVWDPDKVYYKISNHKEPSALNFNLMVSRPNEGKLPSYMIRKFDRNSLYDMTDKSLKLNRFSDGKFMTEYSSFNNKKSFNDKINKELMNSETLINSNLNDIVDHIKGDINEDNNRRMRNKIRNVMEYYNRNFDRRNDINNKNNNFMWKSMDNKNDINNIKNNIKNNNSENENKKKKILPNYNNRYEIKF